MTGADFSAGLPGLGLLVAVAAIVIALAFGVGFIIGAML